MGEASRTRLDSLLLEQGLTGTRSKARALIMAGRVEVDGHVVDKAGTLVKPKASIRVRGTAPYVSRAGEKLAGALSRLHVPVWGASALDLGSSTGGFVDCLLAHGASRVIALDVGYGQLDQRLRADDRVWVMDRTNARHLRPDMLPWTPDLVTADLSFISLEKVLPAVLRCLCPPFRMVLLVKPQFEAGREQVGKGGLVRDPSVHKEVLERILDFAAEALGLSVWGVAPSQVPGTKGNREFFVYAGRERHSKTRENEGDGGSAPDLDTLMIMIDEILEDDSGEGSGPHV